MRGVVFDFGNVLYRVDYPAMAERLAPGRAEELLATFVGSPLQVAYESGKAGLEEVLSGLGRRGFPVSRSRFLDAYLSIFSPVVGMAALLRQLAEGHALGLLSNTSPEHGRLFIEKVPEYSVFRAHVFSFEVGCMKPAPEIYREISRRLAIQAGDLAYVDDVGEFARASENVGMTGITFTSAVSLRASLQTLGLPLRERPGA